MPETPLEQYLAIVRPDARDRVRTLAAAIDAAGIHFDTRITYRMLVCTFDDRWHHWVVAIGVSRSAVSLRFLYGNRLDDPAGLLRPGSSTACTLDVGVADEVDPELVTAYVREAAARHERKGRKN